MTWILRVLLITFFTLPFSSVLLPTEEQAEVAVITGRVVMSANYPLEGVAVILIDPETPDEPVTAAYTDYNGVYTVTQTISNTWKIKFQATGLAGYLPEYYDDTYLLDEATLITAEVGTITPNINAALSMEGQISGRVTTESDGAPLANVKVESMALGSNSWRGGAVTDSAGYYTITAYLAGSYKLRFDPADQDDYALEFYNDKHTLAEATFVTVEKGRDLRGVDVSLEPGGRISGTVTSSWQGKLLASPEVYALNEEGEVVQLGGRYTEIPIYPEPDLYAGTYLVPNLPPGNYQLLFKANRHRPVYRAGLTPVVAGETTANINAQLPISAVVTSIATSPAAPNTIVLAFSHDLVPVISTNGGKNWRIGQSGPWVVNKALFAYPDQDQYNFISVGVAPRGQPGEGTRFLTAIGSQPAYEDLIPGLYRSGDYGQSWAESPIDPAIPAEACYYVSHITLVVSPVTPNDLYSIYGCSYSPTSRLLVSHNAGVTWSDVTTVDNRTLEIPYDIYNSTVVPSPIVGNRIYIASAQGWLQSNDSGLHWDAKNFPVESLALDAKNENYLYGWSPLQGSPLTRFGKRSTDGGNEWWDWAQQPCPYSYAPPQLLAHPTQSQVLLLRCDNDLTDGIYRSDNGGDSWQKLEDEKGGVLAIDYGTPGRILWVKVDGLWASTDNGENWQVLMPGYRILSTPLYLPTLSRENP